MFCLSIILSLRYRASCTKPTELKISDEPFRNWILQCFWNMLVTWNSTIQLGACAACQPCKFPTNANDCILLIWRPQRHIRTIITFFPSSLLLPYQSFRTLFSLLEADGSHRKTTSVWGRSSNSCVARDLPGSCIHNNVPKMTRILTDRQAEELWVHAKGVSSSPKLTPSLQTQVNHSIPVCK